MYELFLEVDRLSLIDAGWKTCPEQTRAPMKLVWIFTQADDCRAGEVPVASASSTVSDDERTYKMS